ncbi:MAG: hypothetical protein GY853_14170 [PVC group bacterium]|nr:hypothetical protein [PVC group bacterium]
MNKTKDGIQQLKMSELQEIARRSGEEKEASMIIELKKEMTKFDKLILEAQKNIYEIL